MKLVSYTVPNPFLDKLKLSDVRGIMWDQRASPAFIDRMCEYAARVCYNSTGSMGNSPNFIQKIIGMSHLDVIEHGTATYALPVSLAHRLRVFNRHFDISSVSSSSDAHVTGNMRCWRDVIVEFDDPHMCDFLSRTLPCIAPRIFDDLSIVCSKQEIPTATLPEIPTSFTQSVSSVILLGANIPPGDHLNFQYGSATLLMDKVSRSLTHQLVRHRLGSYSQESQRYVGTKNLHGVCPPSVFADADALSMYTISLERIAREYHALRVNSNIPKEDARFLLPNATETRIVVTMGFEAWKHFLWLRALDTAAQWEIRHIGQAVLKCLYRVDPVAFGDEMEYFDENRESLI